MRGSLMRKAKETIPVELPENILMQANSLGDKPGGGTWKDGRNWTQVALRRDSYNQRWSRQAVVGDGDGDLLFPESGKTIMTCHLLANGSMARTWPH